MKLQHDHVALIISSKDLPRYIDAITEGHASIRLVLSSSNDNGEIERLTREANRLKELLFRLEDLNRK
jgi:hypothetical protein